MDLCPICLRRHVDPMTLNSTPVDRSMCYQKETGNDPRCYVRRSTVHRFRSSDAMIRIRYTGPEGERHSYAGTITFPDGRRWGFRELCPAPYRLSGMDPCKSDACAAAALCAMHWCGWRDIRNRNGEESYHDELTSDAALEYGETVDNHNETIFVIRSLRGKHMAEGAG